MEIAKLNNFFQNNARYGKNYASFPIRMKLQKTSFFIKKNGVLSLIAYPGVTLDITFEFIFLDHFDQKVLLDYLEYQIYYKFYFIFLFMAAFQTSPSL